MDNKQKIIFYIDGFNLYFGLRAARWKRFYWLDIVKFCEQFIRPHQELVEVNYFTAIPKDKGKQDRQDLFISANKLNPRFHLHLGKFLEKQIPGTTLTTFEEKETDVHIAVQMIRDVVLERCDATVLISADSDLIPAFNFIREYKPLHKIFVYFPPQRHSYDLANKASANIKLENHINKFTASMLPESIKLENGYELIRPKRWN